MVENFVLDHFIPQNDIGDIDLFQCSDGRAGQVHWFGQQLLCLPLGILASALVFKANQQL